MQRSEWLDKLVYTIGLELCAHLRGQCRAGATAKARCCLVGCSPMHEQEQNLHAAPDSRTWAQILARYREPSSARSILELLITALPLVLLWLLMWASLGVGYWLCLLLSVPTAGFLVRLFIIQHDCGHGAFFHQRAVNDWVGRVIGVLTLTPYGFWRRAHAIHHAGSGNLDRRGIGDVDILTVREYLALPRWRRFQYRLYRHPIVMFGIGPAYLFLVQQRLPLGLMRSGWQPWVSTMATNVAIAIVVALMMWLVGVGPFLLVHLPITLLGGSIGVWLFYVQHQFEPTYREHDPRWKYESAALEGSSYYRLPKFLQWLTGNIGLHHVHHLNARIPNYRLQEVFDKNPELQQVTTITMWQSLRCVRLALWDEEKRKLVRFSDALGRNR